MNFACVAEQFGDQKQGDEPGDQEADGIQEAVVAVDGDGACEAEEARSREVVTGDGDAVLRAREGATRSEEFGGGGVLFAGPDDDVERHRDEQDEDADVGGGIADGAALGGQDADIHASPHSSSDRMASARGSSSRFAKRT